MRMRSVHYNVQFIIDNIYYVCTMPRKMLTMLLPLKLVHST